MTANFEYGLAPKQTELIVSVFKKHPDIEKVFIFGSRATNTYTEISDIDFALLGKKLTLFEIMTIKRELEELPIIYTFDVVHLDTLEKTDKEVFLREVLSVAKEFFIKPTGE